MSLIIGFLTSTIGRYFILALIAFGLFAYARFDAQAPLQDAIDQMRQAAANKERIAKADRDRADKAEAEKARLNATLESLIHETKASSCKFDPATLDRLRDLAAGR